MKYDFFATSSSGMDVYAVTISDESGKIVITCTCEAGKRDVLCRHRIALITGKTRGVYAAKSNDAKNLQAAGRMLSEYGVDKRYAELQTMHENLERQWLEIRSQIKTAMNELVLPKG
ncbi:SWIM zinc finger family protein [Rahnella inusitata]|uniref:SWIM zinc finger family protein n=1 Tax=Rahnella inusitata TaxID=58169 RepID=UPI0039B09606